uniref:E3 ubiquitin-protein ligase SINA-like 7 n=1 Tax=Noccaea caerulescens TaxID=107243 RepID=A0A1J3HM37_NOCCA
MNISDKILTLKDIVTRLCFSVQCFRELYGVYVTVSCIAPPAPEVARFSCHLSCTVNGHTMTYESPEVERILEVSFETPNNKFMLIPNSFLSGDLEEEERKRRE